jgi:hypothetical protein
MRSASCAPLRRRVPLLKSDPVSDATPLVTAGSRSAPASIKMLALTMGSTCLSSTITLTPFSSVKRVAVGK